MSELLKLAERCERASGPDRELDLAIGFAVLGWSWGEDGFGGEFLNFGAPNAVGWRQAVDPVPDCVPSPTASLDAAMQLVPEGWDWATGTACAGTDGHAFMRRVGRIGERPSITASATTPALALTAACLKARDDA